MVSKQMNKMANDPYFDGLFTAFTYRQSLSRVGRTGIINNNLLTIDDNFRSMNCEILDIIKKSKDQ